VQVSQPVDGVLRDRRLADKVGLHQVVVEVQLADEGRHGGALLQVVEAEEFRYQGRVPRVEADADCGVIYRTDLLGQLLELDGVVVDCAVDDGQLGEIALDGDDHA
jgi:hypothetical protein